jgi:hypothetical protein
MPLVYTSLGTTPRQVDDFSEGCARSTAGALHFKPESTKVITDAELQHIRDSHPDFASRLVVLDTKIQPKAAVEAKQRPLTSRQQKIAAKDTPTVNPGSPIRRHKEAVVVSSSPSVTVVAPETSTGEQKQDGEGSGKKKYNKF